MLFLFYLLFLKEKKKNERERDTVLLSNHKRRLGDSQGQVEALRVLEMLLRASAAQHGGGFPGLFLLQNWSGVTGPDRPRNF